MRVWKDVFTGDDMMNDIFPHRFEYEDSVLVVWSKMIAKSTNEENNGKRVTNTPVFPDFAKK